jgi:hypothetical protein
LAIQNVLPFGRLTEELRIQLHEILLIEASYLVMKKILSVNNLNDAMIQLEKALPCLLHLENRSSEVMIWHLLRGGLELCKGIELSLHSLGNLLQMVPH